MDLGEIESTSLLVESVNHINDIVSILTSMANCLHCQSPFEPNPREVARGNGKFCTLHCACQFNGAARRRAKAPNVSCAQCQKPFYKHQSEIKKSKSGLVFCSPQCKGQAQRIGGIPDVQPEHYGTSERYRVLALKHYPAVCELCGYDRHPEVLHIHHRDSNHSNNVLSNLAVVCPTCHEEAHFLSKTGKWGSKGGTGEI